MSRSSYFLANALLLISAIPSRIDAQQDVGDRCTATNGEGVCSLLEECKPVYNDLLAGKMPTKICGYRNFDPIVCCPKTQSPTPPPMPNRFTDAGLGTNVPASTRPIGVTVKTPIVDRSRGAIARQRCFDYSQATFALVIPPTLSGQPKAVNTSMCTLKQRTLIVGGKKADPKEFPHMTAIGYNNEGTIVWLCGGTLVSDRFVLTAAHCTYSEYGRAVRARVGDLNLANPYDDARPEDRDIIERIRHPSYKYPSDYHDIALLKLDKAVQFNAYVKPACLPYGPTDVTLDQKVMATGWGRVDWTDEEGSDDLLKVTIGLVPHSQCNSTYSDGQNPEKLRFGIVGEWQLCAGEFGKDTCQGDSGGPISVRNRDFECMYNVVGVTSVGRVCGSIVPGVYTRVSHYLEWLEGIIWADD